MNRHLHCALLTVSFLFLASALYARTPTAELMVKGQIVAPRCNINLNAVSTDGSFPLDHNSDRRVADQGHVRLSSQDGRWEVRCNMSIYLSLSTIDNRADSTSLPTGADNFGLGFVNGDDRLGYYKVLLHNLRADGKPAKIFKTRSGGTASVQSSHYLSTQSRLGWAGREGILKAGKRFSADIKITPYMADQTMLKGTGDEKGQLDGSITTLFTFGL